jgi:hypothetical protein
LLCELLQKLAPKAATENSKAIEGGNLKGLYIGIVLFFTGLINCCGDFAWVTWMQGDASAGIDVAADRQGSSYIFGIFYGAVIFGNHSITSMGGSDLFVAKVNRAGEVDWIISGGSTNNDDAFRIAPLIDGTVIITGRFNNEASFAGVSGLNGNFVANISHNGNIEWIRLLTNASASAVFVEEGRRMWLAGTQDGFLTFEALDRKGDTAAHVVTDAMYFPAKHVAVDDDGALYAAGATDSAFIFGTNIVSGYFTVYVARFRTNGSSEWVNRLSFSYYPSTVGLLIADDHSVTVSGNASVGFSPAPPMWVTLPSGGYRSPAYFHGRFAPSGELLSAGAYGQYKGSWRLSRTAQDSNGRRYAVGSFNASYVSATPWYRGAFIAGPGFTYTVTNSVRYSTFDVKQANSICGDDHGFTYVTGSFNGTAWFGSKQVASDWGGPHAFIGRIDDAAKPKQH